MAKQTITEHQFALLANMFHSEYSGINVGIAASAPREDLLSHTFFTYDFSAFANLVEIPEASRGGVVAGAQDAELIDVGDEFRPDGPDSGGVEMYMTETGVAAFLDACEARNVDASDFQALRAALD